MLDLLPSTPEGVVNDRVPMDLSQYLLSASPPSLRFDFMALSIHQSPNSNNNNVGNNTLNHEFHQHPTNPSNLNHHDNCQFSPYNNNNNNINMNAVTCSFHHSSSSFSQSMDNGFHSKPPKRGALKSPESYSYCSDSDGESCGSSDSRSQSPRRTPKRVSFADHKGLALAQVRLVKESPDEPPQLSSKVLSILTQGANAGITSNPPIKLCFPQPASDYMAFRDKVIHNLVSLENVILSDYTVKGTIKVKNITFEKKVFVRLSMDEWVSHEDHAASYVPGPGNGFVDANDTFSFQLDISPLFDVTKKIQFAVCFEENGKEHWDNNSGANYCIVSESFGSESAQQSALAPVNHNNERWLPEKNADSSWTEFSVWRDVRCSDPYY